MTTHTHPHLKSRPPLTRFAWLSIAAALTTILLKAGAYLLTGSVGLLSDAAESIVNLVGAVMALTMLIIAARPADPGHTYGHSKAEYFSSGVEGALILVAACGIIWSSTERLLHPKPLEQLGLGLVVSLVASLINFVVAQSVKVASGFAATSWLGVSRWLARMKMNDTRAHDVMKLLVFKVSSLQTID